ncbi:hypothetical protein N5C72_24070 [Achromobacter mucicolens]|uniref:Apea-like HEPN domain-containing protein n=1 Tax=Achromobacter mucicolens TaxID=1389922 RepID=A0ABD4Z246_9BURK|nr:hypothetical protein [Achromobacter mucicolens]MDH1181164.1 hypothetical protein [Achromobacter mucicolens]
MSEDEKMKILLGDELNDKEAYLIGKIVAAWASLEHEVFEQTLQTYVPAIEREELSKLPKEMNNIQFTGVLRLWKERVVDQAKGRRRKTLEGVYEGILQRVEYRKAIVHGMWNWSLDNADRITSTRIVGKQIISVHFDADILYSFMTDLQEINFDLRYPRGPTEFAMQRGGEGLRFSRRFAAIMTGERHDAALPATSGNMLRNETRGSGDEEESRKDSNP